MIIKATNVSVEYSNKETAFNALKNISFNVLRGEFLVILGPSGSGKSTLLRTIAGLLRPSTGSLIVDGIETNKLNEEELARYRSRKVGIVFQFFNLIPELTALENIYLPLTISKTINSEAKERIDYLIERFGLENKRTRFPRQLSGGEQQRVAIVRALASRPAVLLADEPTGNLDSATGSDVIETLCEAAREFKQTVIVASHDSDLASRATRTLMLRDGLLDEDKQTAEVL